MARLAFALGCTCILIAVAGLGGVGSAAATGEASQGRLSWRAFEDRVLGREHAAEHARYRSAQRDAARRWRRMSPADRRRAESTQTTAVDAGPPDQVGEWTQAPFPLPNYAIHAALLPTGKVLFFGYPPRSPDGTRANYGKAALWDPAAGTGPAAFEDVPPPQIDADGDGNLEVAPIYCAGQAPLANGSLLVTGGNVVWPSKPGDQYTDYAGLDTVFTFDPWSETWIRQPDSDQGRWYPSAVRMADGRMLIFGGYTETAPGAHLGTEVEVFDPSADPGGVGTITPVPSASRTGTLYPHLFLLPDSSILLAGPQSTDSAILDTSDFTWTGLPSPLHRNGGAAVLMPGTPGGSWKVLAIGGYGPSGGNPFTPARNSTEVLNAKVADPSWHSQKPLQLGRSWPNTVLLPDRSMVTVGGGNGFSSTDGNWSRDPAGQQRQVELYDPATRRWRLGPAEAEDRTYHSTALLLPDGRVWSAGDDRYPLQPDGKESSGDTGEIYSPPYLFKGSRPAISSAPSALAWGDVFGVGSDSAGLAGAVLMAPAAVTHANDMNQRLVPLKLISTTTGGINVKSPPSAAVAPPGYYMLFLLNDQGVPSVASWVRLDPTAPDAPRVH
jgi:hypothetical protein